LGNQNHGLWITETGVRDDWLNSARPSIGLNQVCAPAYKPEYLRQMFLKAGDNNTYDVPKVFIYRFTRAQHGDSSNWNTAGVYDSHPDPNVPNHPEYGSSDCGMAALASAAGPFGPD
jgi:hypothetical protein